MKLFFVLLLQLRATFILKQQPKKRLKFLILFHHWNIATLIL